jgi:hypothetical protein
MGRGSLKELPVMDFEMGIYSAIGIELYPIHPFLTCPFEDFDEGGAEMVHLQATKELFEVFFGIFGDIDTVSILKAIKGEILCSLGEDGIVFFGHMACRDIEILDDYWFHVDSPLI